MHTMPTPTLPPTTMPAIVPPLIPVGPLFVDESDVDPVFASAVADGAAVLDVLVVPTATSFVVVEPET